MLPPPRDSMEGYWAPHEKQYVEQTLALAVVGGPQTVRDGLERFIRRTGVDELIVTGQIYDHAARRHSLELTAQARAALA